MENDVVDGPRVLLRGCCGSSDLLGVSRFRLLGSRGIRIVIVQRGHHRNSELQSVSYNASYKGLQKEIPIANFGNAHVWLFNRLSIIV